MTQLWTTLLLLALLSGCSTPAPLHYYRLDLGSPGREEVAATPVAEELLVGLWPIELPDELQRSEVVSYQPGGRVILSPRHLWAGDLAANIERQLGQRLAIQLGQGVWHYPWAGLPPEQTLRLDIQQLGGALDGEVTLQANWAFSHKGDPQSQQLGRIRLVQQVSGSGHLGYVQALAQLVERLADTLASHLQRAASAAP